MENIVISKAQYLRDLPSVGEPLGSLAGIKATIDGTEIFVPADESNVHYAEIMRQVEAGNLAIQEAEVPPFNSESVLAEVKRRIEKYASPASQMNMTAAQSVGMLGEDDKTAFIAGLHWITQMRTRGRELAAAEDVDYALDEKWPEAPAESVALASLF